MWEEAEAELTNDFLREVGGSEPKREGQAEVEVAEENVLVGREKIFQVEELAGRKTYSLRVKLYETLYFG